MGRELEIIALLRAHEPWSSAQRMCSALRQLDAPEVTIRNDGRIWADWFPDGDAEDRSRRSSSFQACEVLVGADQTYGEAMFYLDFVETMEVATYEEADEESERRFAARLLTLNTLGAGRVVNEYPQFERIFSNAPMGGFRHAVVWVDDGIRVGLAMWLEDSGLPITTTLHIRPGGSL